MPTTTVVTAGRRSAFESDSGLKRGDVRARQSLGVASAVTGITGILDKPDSHTVRLSPDSESDRKIGMRGTLRTRFFM
jgi:hypothetical protein